MGINNDTIISCYSTGSVRGGNCTGGLAGDNRSGTITSSFWDTQTSGQSESDGGIGLPTPLLWDIETYLKTGWDFFGETINGSDDIWWMPENDYPQLWWQAME